MLRDFMRAGEVPRASGIPPDERDVGGSAAERSPRRRPSGRRRSRVLYGDHLRRIPSLYYAIAFGYVVLRIAAVFGTTVSGGFPDSATYRAGPGGASFPFVSFTGHAIRPWVVPLFYKVLPSDNVRSAAQVASRCRSEGRWRLTRARSHSLSRRCTWTVMRRTAR